MKKILVVLLVAVAAFGCFAQGAKKKPVITIKTTLAGEKTVFKPGEDIPFKVEYKCPEGYRLAAWCAVAYLKNVPAEFPKAMNKKVSGKPPYQSVSFMSYKWLPKGKEIGTLSFSTKGFPEGDYKINITGLFREIPKGKVESDVYRGSQVVFSIEK